MRQAKGRIEAALKCSWGVVYGQQRTMSEPVATAVAAFLSDHRHRLYWHGELLCRLDMPPLYRSVQFSSVTIFMSRASLIIQDYDGCAHA